MLLSDKQILLERKKGNIVIEPFDEKQLGTNAYDVRLGEYYYTLDGDTHLYSCIDPFDETCIKRLFKLRKSENDILIPPQETFLCHTIEVIGGRNRVTSSMRARSSVGRLGISVAKCAGMGDVNFVNRWTMEVSNHNKHMTVALEVGMRIAQMLFFRVGETLKTYQGKYMEGAWTPENMLPKLWKDYERLKE